MPLTCRMQHEKCLFVVVIAILCCFIRVRAFTLRWEIQRQNSVRFKHLYLFTMVSTEFWMIKKAQCFICASVNWAHNLQWISLVEENTVVGGGGCRRNAVIKTELMCVCMCVWHGCLCISALKIIGGCWKCHQLLLTQFSYIQTCRNKHNDSVNNLTYFSFRHITVY